MPDETKFEVDSLWAKPCRAYHVQHEPDQATIRQITELQDQIEATAARELLPRASAQPSHDRADAVSSSRERRGA